MARTKAEIAKARGPVWHLFKKLGACNAGLKYVEGKTFDQAWELCDNAGFFIWWVRVVWAASTPEMREMYFPHTGYTREIAVAVAGNTEDGFTQTHAALKMALFYTRGLLQS